MALTVIFAIIVISYFILLLIYKPEVFFIHIIVIGAIGTLVFKWLTSG